MRGLGSWGYISYSMDGFKDGSGAVRRPGVCISGLMAYLRKSHGVLSLHRALGVV